jgi:diguanylate cyclase (GGDEF)-like protein
MDMNRQGKVLVIDDDPTSLHLIADILEPAGYDLIFGSSGDDAFARVDKTIDLILLDYHLPEENGIEICERLKQDPEFKDIPVIFITANQDGLLEAEGFAAGAVDFITKPYSAAVMKARVKTHVALKRQTDKLVEITRIDELTRVFNRRYVFDVGEREFNRALRIDSELCVMVMDIDFFKRVNDQYGHDMGDRALQAFAKTVAERVRNTDVFGRIGGEEFVVVLPDTSVQDALSFGETLLSIVRHIALPTTDDKTLNITVSIGLAAREPQDADLSDMLKRADKNLYRAKQTGRDQICV